VTDTVKVMAVKCWSSGGPATDDNLAGWQVVNLSKDGVPRSFIFLLEKVFSSESEAMATYLNMKIVEVRLVCDHDYQAVDMGEANPVPESAVWCDRCARNSIVKAVVGLGMVGTQREAPAPV